MSNTDTVRSGDPATAVGALVLGAMLVLVLLRRGFGDLVPRIGG